MAKSKIFALVLIFAAIGVAAGTGAFTTAEADRTAEVNVAGDANALLGIEQADSTGGNELVDVDGSSQQVVLNLSNASNQGATGINADAATDFGNVLNFTNNGEDTIQVKIETNTEDVNPRSVHFYVGNSSEPSTISGSLSDAQLDTVAQSGFDSNAANASNSNNPDRFAADQKYSITSDINAGGSSSHIVIELDPGDTVTVGFAVDLFGQELDDTDNVVSNMTIIADEDLSGETDADAVVADEELSDDPEDLNT